MSQKKKKDPNERALKERGRGRDKERGKMGRRSGENETNRVDLVASPFPFRLGRSVHDAVVNLRKKSG